MDHNISSDRIDPSVRPRDERRGLTKRRTLLKKKKTFTFIITYWRS